MVNLNMFMIMRTLDSQVIQLNIFFLFKRGELKRGEFNRGTVTIAQRTEVTWQILCIAII